MPADDRLGLFFVLILIVIILFVIGYMWRFAVLFALQVDSLDELVAFCESQMNGIEEYGEEFERLVESIKSSVRAFQWKFIITGHYESASAFIWGQLLKRLVALCATIIIPQLMVFLARGTGVTEATFGENQTAAFADAIEETFS